MYYCGAKLVPERDLKKMIDYLNGINEDISVVRDIYEIMEDEWKDGIIPFLEGLHEKYKNNKVSIFNMFPLKCLLYYLTTHDML